jgi:hypothetical protein
MSYYTLKNTCDNYHESGTALTSNTKFINPYLSDGKTLMLYDMSNHNLNSNIYNNNNLYPCTKSYDYVQKSYQHYITQLMKKN